MTRWFIQAAWPGLAGALLIWLLLPQPGQAHTVVFPQMPAVILAPPPPLTPLGPSEMKTSLRR